MWLKIKMYENKHLRTVALEDSAAVAFVGLKLGVDVGYMDGVAVG